MKLSEFINKLKEFKFKKQIQLSNQRIKFDNLYKEILTNIEIVKKEILIPLWENPVSYYAIIHDGCTLMDNKIHIHDFRVSSLIYLSIDENRVMISLKGHLLNDNYKLVQKETFNYLVLNDVRIIFLTEALEYLEFFNKELKSLIKNKSKIYKQILKTLY